METNYHGSPYLPEENPNSRRGFLKKSIMIGALAGISGANLLPGCREEAGEEVTPAEDLMREHGVLDRIMLVYDKLRMQLLNNEKISLDILNNSAQIVKTFIEEYHEKLEEDHLFPLFEKAGMLTDLTGILRTQHKAGRNLTGRIIEIGMQGIEYSDDIKILPALLESFNSMYRPHAAREDTVLFPEIRKVVPEDEYITLGENFEDKEHELFGEEGFEGIVEKVSKIEQQLGIYELSLFTPASQ
ncbi:MAG: hemerythrin domain-containing protein [Bacteroidales bacterium]